MFKISGKQQFGAVWENGECIAVFNRGVATTDDSAVADIMRAKGYTVEGEAPVVDPLAGMKVEELKAYAAEKGIDIGEATKKADILAAIKAADSSGE